MTCARCGDMDREKFEALPNPLASESTCAKCIGMSYSMILDVIYRLDTVPTDALLRALARRFL